ncbi:entericidin B membrane lipoprotein [Aquimixticola soesokkakensis]|uniref:Entericidin B membrane lipoprotein n=1 Tax=Aquimixticola soesokkakensis TaxID=1519096 RepID=A0A1Y5SHC7_9RHOB|nr:entericidin EcnA/B family protein [Aquimixticola soesokkakensis]SLN40864.1 entericidin B membrane lipoprotein [Aquimixticola soesokkakensis]
MTRVLTLTTLLALASLTAACNTVAGVGEDVSGGARTVQSWF